MARERRRHVAQQHVGGPAEGAFEKFMRIRGADIVAQDLGPRHRLHRGHIHRDHPAAFGRSGTHPFDRHLGPAAWRGAKIDDALAGAQNPAPVIDLDQFEGGARAVAPPLGLGHVGVGELAGEPAGRGGFAAFDRPRWRPRAAAAGSATAHLGGAVGNAAPGCIRPRRMPSRRPRSATLSRPTGHSRQIASRMAAPAITRSARSTPMQGWLTRPS